MTPALIDTIARCPKVARKLHLPFQSGERHGAPAHESRLYGGGITSRSSITPGTGCRSWSFPAMSSSGFPMRRRRNFPKPWIWCGGCGSNRCLIDIRIGGTPAAAMEDATPTEEKKQRFSQLLACQNEITRQVNQTYLSRRLRVLIDGRRETPPIPTARGPRAASWF